MEFAQYQLQIFVSLVVIMGAAFVALICDFLKRNNEYLRELVVELKVRREEEHRTQPITEPAVKAQPAAELPAPAARTMAAPAPERERKRTPSSDALAAMERGARMASTPRPRRVPQPQRAVEAPQEREAAAQPEVAAGPVAVGKTDWNSSDVPAGFHEGFVLSQLVQNRKPVSGLVVSIGVNTPRNADGSMPESVKQLIQSLIGPGDFACQSSDEEFLLIYPNESGASAQRRLSYVAQQLWDFQLRSLGTFQILFSWGGLEVRSESIDEAIASANERMQQTRRGRKLVTMEARHDSPLRKAV
ncbi:MAG TPA: hypothetical protein VMG40_15720 [Bryobacteraceae bacterium]|nr:hypothetical protein [Bryobacteraceae bacterium]